MTLAEKEIKREPKIPITVRIAAKTHRQIRFAAAVQHLSIGDWLAEAVVEKIHRERKDIVKALKECDANQQ